METKSYMGVIHADPSNLLIGGLESHYSSRMETKGMAEHWIEVVTKVNEMHGRKVRSSEVLPSNYAPEILKRDAPATG